MSSKKKDHYCLECDYRTDNRSNFNKHKKTKKHERNIAKQQTTHVCQYCEHSYSRKDSLTRHLKICPQKNSDIDIMKREIENLRRKNKKIKKQKKKREERIEELTEENKEILDDYNSFLKETTNKALNKVGNTYNTTNSMNFIIQNFPNAYNFEDMLAQQVDPGKQMEYFKMGSIKGGAAYLHKLCIENIKPENRPLWCTDSSRNNYMLKTEDSWVRDLGGKRIQEMGTPYIRQFFNDILASQELSNELKMQYIMDLIELEKEKGKKLLISELSNKSLINNVIAGRIEA